jgi:hypothetical protein
MFVGYKTYIVAAVAVITSIAGYLVGDITLPVAAQAVLTSILGATLRSGIANSVAK